MATREKTPEVTNEMAVGFAPKLRSVAAIVPM
jgi:hypothetical protein